MKKLKVLSLIFAGFLLFSCSNFFDFSEAQKPFSVTFNSNGGSGTMEQQEFFHSESQALIMNRFSRTGYEFAGWAKKANANEVEYIDGQTVNFNNAVTLYAKWNANKYTVKFYKNADDATGDVADIQAVYDTEFALPENAFAKIGYNFGGWNTKKDGSGTTHKAGEKMKNLSAENGDVVTLYANWIEKGTHSITYELNGGNHDGTPTTSFLETKDVTLGAAARTGYTFSGWYEAEDFSGNAVTGWNAGEKTEDVTLYAKWNANKYTVKFDKNADDATGDVADIHAVYDTEFALPENAFAKIGYNFGGWNTKKDGSGTTHEAGEKMKNLSAENDDVVTLYAKWLETYTIAYELNGGTNADENPENYDVETETITLKAATKVGYVFVGWYKEDSFTTKVTEITKGSTGNITLYAKWIIIADTVADAIGALSGEGPHDIAVVGEITADTISVIRAALNKNITAKVNLDLSQTTGLTSIRNSAFSDCSSLTSVTIPNSVTSIGSSAFAGCSSLTSVTIPDSITFIGISAFAGCSSLTSVTIPNSVTSISSYAFDDCNSLTSVTIFDSVTFIDGSVFRDCRSLKFNEFDNAKYLGNENNPYFVLIEAKDKSITSCNINTAAKVIAGSAFEDCNALTSVVIPDSVASICKSAFRGCKSLISVTIPDGVTSIGSGAFYGCNSLTSVTIPDSVTSISSYTFSNCIRLTSVTISDGVTSIGSSMFQHCISLTSVTIPDSVTSIGSFAFSSCSSLTSVTIPNSVTSISSYAFYGCSSLTELIVSENNSVYKSYENCIYTKDGKTLIAVAGGVTSVVIPDSVTSIGNGAFSGCNLTSVTIPNSVTSIDSYAFEDCIRLTSVTIPDSVTSISSYAFSGCISLTSVTIPDSVTSIGGAAFNHCSSLTTVNYKGSEEQWNVISISNGNDSLTSATINYNYTGE